MSKTDLGVVIFYAVACPAILVWTLTGRLHLLGRTKRFGGFFDKTPAGTHFTMFITASCLSALLYIRWFAGYRAPFHWVLMLIVAFGTVAVALELQLKALKRLDDAEGRQPGSA